MQIHKKWTSEDLKTIFKMRKSGKSWTEMEKSGAFENTAENIRAAFRRAVGGKYTAYADKEQKVLPKLPTIAIIDIETIPGISFFWNMYDELNNIEMVIVPPCMVSWAGRYLHDPEIHSDIMTSEEAIERDTKRISKSVWDFLRKADVVVGHNYSGFDVKYINTEWLKHGIRPLKYPIIDTLQIVRQNFKFASNKMKFINDQLGIRNKLETEGFPLWDAVSKGDPEALHTMLEYNRGDIGATEDLFYKVRPYVKNFNVAIYSESTSHQCPVCGSENLSFEERPWPTPAGLWESARCEDCGCLFRLKHNTLSTEKKKSLGVNS